jgi:hypothetical protein
VRLLLTPLQSFGPQRDSRLSALCFLQNCIEKLDDELLILARQVFDAFDLELKPKQSD